jgi:mRNA interferase RelE/StbE
LAWTVRYTRQATKTLSRLDRPVAERILAYMTETATLDDPQERGKALVGTLSGLWRFRVGDWRVICDVDGSTMVILALEIDHRSRIYGRR